MNAGIRATSAEYVVRLDSDDLWLPDLLVTEIAILETRPEIGLVCSKSEGVNQDLSSLPFTIGYAPHYRMTRCAACCGMTAQATPP
jgi:glycosyltransferase involved in cell wall biosynthesis